MIVVRMNDKAEEARHLLGGRIEPVPGNDKMKALIDQGLVYDGPVVFSGERRARLRTRKNRWTVEEIMAFNDWEVIDYECQCSYHTAGFAPVYRPPVGSGGWEPYYSVADG